MTFRVFAFFEYPRETWIRRPDFEPIQITVNRRRCVIAFGAWRKTTSSSAIPSPTT